MYSYDSIFEWDEKKNLKNIEKHGFSFEDAPEVFNNPTVTFIDERYDYGEIRHVTLGTYLGRTVFLVYTIRENYIRLISMRKANAREQKIYQERLETCRRN
jgi:uncharacterized protein